jgi:hypothetical protein
LDLRCAARDPVNPDATDDALNETAFHVYFTQPFTSFRARHAPPNAMRL